MSIDTMGCTVSEIMDKAKDAELILVGIGEEFQYDWDILLGRKRYREIESEIGDNEEYKWIYPFLQKMALEEYPDENLADAYRKLKEILDGRNYFIISTVTDDYVYRYGFKEEKIVTPCGGFKKMQCDDNCTGKLIEPDYETYEKVKLYYSGKADLNTLHEPSCENCSKKIRFNQIGTAKYAQEGYLPQWEAYMKWLQGTVNRKVCVIELGVGMQLPTIIRWPFERIVYYNKKAYLYRIHSTLYQLEEKIGDRGMGIREKPVNFLSNGFVK